MTKSRLLASLTGLTLGCTGVASAAIAPYTPDADTLVLYHFDEAPGATDPGNPFLNAGTAGSGLNLTNTGGPDGRDNTGGGGYGAAAYTGLGSAFDSLASGNGEYHSESTGTNVGGGAITAGAVAQSTLQGASGSFTYEALINLDSTNGIAAEQTILSHDGSGSSTRGFMLRVLSGNLNFFYPTSSSTNATITAAIPDSGDHAFVADEWFHIALSYDGNEGVAGSLKFYWTRLDANVTQANQVGASNLALANDLLSTADVNRFGVGTATRSPFRFEPHLVDEVRISSVARGAGDFLFAVPEPASVLLSLAGLTLIGRRSRHAR